MKWLQSAHVSKHYRGSPKESERRRERSQHFHHSPREWLSSPLGTLEALKRKQMKVYFHTDRGPVYPVEDVMATTPGQLCELGWPLLAPPEQWRPLTDIYFPPPMRVSASTKACEQSFLKNITAAADHVMDQVSSSSFASCEEPMGTTHRLRSAVFQRSLRQLQDMPESRLSTSSTTMMAPSSSLPGAIHSVANATEPSSPMVFPSPHHTRSASNSPPAASDISTQPVGKAQRRRGITPCMANTARDDQQDDLVASRRPGNASSVSDCGIPDVSKPDATVTLLYTATDADVSQAVQAAASANEAQTRRLVRAAAVLAVNARLDHCAGAAFVRLLRMALRTEAEFRSSLAPKRGATVAFTGKCHESFVVGLLLPLLHFVPLVGWGTDARCALGDILSTAEAPRLRGDFKDADHSFVVSFTAKSTFGVMRGRDGSAFGERVAHDEEVRSTPSSDAVSSAASHTNRLHELVEESTHDEDEEVSRGQSQSPHANSVHHYQADYDTSATSASETTSLARSNSEYYRVSVIASDPGTGMAASASAAEAADTHYSSTTVLRLAKASSVTVRIYLALACDQMRVLMLPLHPSKKTGDVVASCHEPVTGDCYRTTSPSEVHFRSYSSALAAGTPASAEPTVLSGEVLSKVSLTLDTRMTVEWRLALLHAQRFIAEQILEDISADPSLMRNNSTGHPPQPPACNLPPALFQNGLRDEVVPAPRHPFVESIAQLSDQELRLRTRCRQSDLPGVRVVLMVIARFLTWNGYANNDGAEVHWKSRVWADVLRRVSVASTAFNTRLQLLELVNFMVDDVEGCKAAPGDVVDATIALFSRTQLSVPHTRTLLEQRRTKAQCAVVMLTLLRESLSYASPKDLTLTVKSTKRFLNTSGHYLSSFTGSGAGIEETIRRQLHLLLASIFALLRGIVARGTRSHAAPHRFLFHAWEFAPFMIVAISLLASHLDDADVSFICREGIASQVTSMLPDFTALSRTDSFLVDEDEEFSVAKVLVEYFYDRSCEGEGTGEHCRDDGGVVMVGTTQESPRIFFSASGTAFAYSEDPVFCGESTQGGSSKTFHVHLLNDQLTCFYVGLATNALSFSQPNISNDTGGIYYHADGALHHHGLAYSLLPLHGGDVVSLTFSFEVKQWRIGMVVNGFLIASFAAPRQPLHLVLGFTDMTYRAVSYRGICGRPMCAPTKVASPPSTTLQPGGDPSNRTSEDFSYASDVQRLGLQARGPHMKMTLYNASLYTALVLHYLVLSCSRRMRATTYSTRRRSACVTPTPNHTPALRQGDEAMATFVNSCCPSLRHNISALVRAIGGLPDEGSTEDPTERVRRQTALLIYSNLLLDYVITLSVTVGCAASLGEVMNTFTDVVCCTRATEKTRSVALSAAFNTLSAPSMGTGLSAFQPARLWQCCVRLAQDVTRHRTRPCFTTVSVPAEISVRGGGRSIVYKSTGSQRTVSYGSDAFAMDGTMGETYTFSVRLQRGFATETLGRFYHVGVASCRGRERERLLSSYPGDRSRQHAVFSLTDFFSDATESCKKELKRFRSHWLSEDENIIFGSGDVITVTVSARDRTIRFDRNGHALGTLYTAKNVGPDVKTLFPFVELYNRDATAKWMDTLHDLLTNARNTMRVMLRRWPSELLQPMSNLIEEGAAEGDSTALQVLGSDGDELSHEYRTPPRTDVVNRVQTVHLLRIEGRWALVQDESGTLFRVISAALEPNYTSTITVGYQPHLLAAQLLTAVLTMSPPMNPGASWVTIQRPAFFLRALRLLSEWFSNPALVEDNDALRALQARVVERLLGVLKIQSLDLASNVILREAWNEICWAYPDHERYMSPIVVDTAAGPTPGQQHSSPTEEGCLLDLRCPTCGVPWDTCTAHHHVPANTCEQCHLILRLHGRPSPYVGWFAAWGDVSDSPEASECEGPLRMTYERDSEAEGGMSRSISQAVSPTPATIEFQQSAKGPTAVEGVGQVLQGTFTFTGRLTSSTTLTARIQFDHTEGGEDTVGGGGPATVWSCAACTFENPPDAIRCMICATVKPGATWRCLVCHYAYNPKSSNVCATCGQVSPVAAGRSGRARGRDWHCYCSECQTKREYQSFSSLQMKQHCDHCNRVTRWLPQEKYSGIMEARLLADGDELEFTYRMEGDSYTTSGLRCRAYSADDLKRAVETLGDDRRRYVAPLSQRNVSTDCPTLQPSAVNPSQSCLPSAIAYYASRLVLLWGPSTNPELFTSVQLLTQLRVYDEVWLDHFRTFPLPSAAVVLRTCLDTLLRGTTPCPHAIQAVSSAARIVMKANPPLQSQASYLLLALCMTSARHPTERTREGCLAAITALFEDYPNDFLNAQCLGPLLRQHPVVNGQQRVAVFAILRHVSTGGKVPSTQATGSLVRAVECMLHKEPLPKLMDANIAEAFPHIVNLAKTRVSEGGELQVGQVRGSVGYPPSKGGCYYFEVVFPQNFADASNTLVMGWGTLQHEHISSSQHVGSDLHSWGYNCRDRLRLMMGEQLLLVPKRPVAGDVIGSMMNLETMMVCWSINGEELMWVSVPAQGNSEDIYPYVSASVEPCGVEIRLGNTQFKPAAYTDFSAVSEESMWGTVSDATPQSYEFYQELSTLLDTLSVTDLHAAASVGASLASPSGQRQLPQFPRVMDFITAQDKHNTSAASVSSCDGALEVDTTSLAPYVAHLSAISDLTVLVARHYSLIKDSPYLTQCYRRAKDLLFSAARWTIYETQAGCRPTYNVQVPRTVRIDLEKAKSVLEAADTSPGDALRHSVTGQLFAQIETAPIYKNAVMFAVQLADGVTTDVGGVTRFTLSMIASEINYQLRDGTRCDPALPLFRLCAHSTMFTVVPNMEQLRIEQEDEEMEGRDRLTSRMLMWLGMLMGNVTLCGTMKLTLAFPRLAWKYLSFEDATIEDYYYDVDDTVRGSVADDDFLLNDEYFYSIPGITSRSDFGEVSRDMAQPPTAGHSATVTLGRRSFLPYLDMTPTVSAVDLASHMTANTGYDDLEVYTTQEHAKKAKRRRLEAESALLHQYDPALLCIRNGLSTVLSESSLKSIRWDDLQSRICGSAHISAEHLIDFLDWSSVSAVVQEMLRQVLQNLTEQQRSLFLLFCSGQSRLPLPERISLTCGDDPSQLPTAHTCSPMSLRLQPYRSAAEMREKILLCLSNAKVFGFV